MMNDSMKELTLGRRIAKLRKAQGITQEVLAEALGITHPHNFLPRDGGTGWVSDLFSAFMLQKI